MPRRCYLPFMPIMPTRRFRRRRLLPVTFACAVLATAGEATADSPVYAEAAVAASGVRHSDVDFYPIFGSVTLGAYVWPGIGVELFADRGIAEDEKRGFDLSLEEAEGAALRFRSPEDNGLSGYIVLGYVDFMIEQERADAGDDRALEVELSGARVSIGVSQRLRAVDSLIVSAEYRNYYTEEDVRVDGLLLSLGWNLP